MIENAVSVRELEEQYSSGAYLKREVTIIRGEGAYLYDDAGRRYIDCVTGRGVANLGHGHPAIQAAIQRQLSELIICPEIFYNPVRAAYQAALVQAAGGSFSRVFLCNSGTEAIEAALKIARLVTGRHGVISSMRAFHGRTMGALSATWEKTYREPFEPLIQGVSFVPFNNIERLEAALTPDTAAVILEPVQGEGGVHPAQAGYLRKVQDACRANGTLLIIDEIQTGFGRTGSLFAYQQHQIQPDLVPLAKSIAGGLPMGAVLMSEAIGALPPASHGTTFGGSPLACAAGLAVLELLSDPALLARVQQLGDSAQAFFREHLKETAYRDIRGRGLLLGVELRGKVAPILQALQDRGILALPAGSTVLRLLPPLTIDEQDWLTVLQTVVEVLNHAAA